MKYSDAKAAIEQRRKAIRALHSEIQQLVAETEPETVQDYVFDTPTGEIALSELFEGKDSLFVVHNMGKSCANCTLWADGFNGVNQHLNDRAPFVLSSPDAPEVQSTFAESRGWQFPMVSHANNDFAQDMGYKREAGYWPGVSVFQRRNDEIVRVSDTVFGPGDDFAGIWHLFDLLPEGVNGWDPKFSYP